MTLDLARRLEYAVSAQFVDRLEEGGKINTMEKLRDGWSQRKTI